jgi:hypothetical protein
MTTRPRRRAIQYPDVAAAATSGGTARAVVRKEYAESAVPVSTPVCNANPETPDQTATGTRIVRCSGVSGGDEGDCDSRAIAYRPTLPTRMLPSPILDSSTPVEALDSIELMTANGNTRPSAPTGCPKQTLIDGQDTPSRTWGRDAKKRKVGKK